VSRSNQTNARDVERAKLWEITAKKKEKKRKLQIKRKYKQKKER
jgi:hypothetical protein